MPSGVQVTACARSSNHHDLACFTVGQQVGPTTAGREQGGQYHFAWQVSTLADPQDHERRIIEAGALKGASDHGVNKSLCAMDPDGIESEVVWLTPTGMRGDQEHQAIVRPLDLDADIETAHMVGVGAVCVVHVLGGD